MRIVERVFFVAGCLLFAWLLWHIGPATLLRDLRLVGWGFVIVFGQELLAILFNTLGWVLLLPPEHRKASFGTLTGIRLAGDAVNYATPTATIGGEFVKARLLARHVPMPVALSSVSLTVLVQFVSQVLFVLLALPLFASLLSDRSGGGVVFGGLGLLLVIVAVIAFMARRGDLFRTMHRLLDRMPLVPRAWLPAEERWREMDEHVFGVLASRPRDSLLALLLFVAGWLMGAVEVYFTLWFLGAGVGWATAISIEALSVLVDVGTFFVPAKIGTQEGGKYAIFLLLGLDPANGFALGCVRRLREIGWASVGLVIFGWFQRGTAGALVPEGSSGAGDAS